jgi:hypothetical protein
MRKILYPVLIIVCIAVSCQKEISDKYFLTKVNTRVDSCRISNSYYFGNSGAIIDSADFIYTGLKLIKVVGADADVIYSYSGNKLTSMFYYEKPGNLLYHIDSFQYINDTVLSKIIAHDYDMYNHFDTVHSVLNFIYIGNKLTRIITVDQYEGFPDTDSTISDFRWTGDNVSSIFFRSTVWADDSIHYTYDNNPNYFNTTSKYFFMADPFFEIHAGFEPHLPYFISKNNVINFRIYTNVDYPVVYETDSLHHPILIKVGGWDNVKYKWVCP